MIFYVNIRFKWLNESVSEIWVECKKRYKKGNPKLQSKLEDTYHWNIRMSLEMATRHASKLTLILQKQIKYKTKIQINDGAKDDCQIKVLQNEVDRMHKKGWKEDKKKI